MCLISSSRDIPLRRLSSVVALMAVFNGGLGGCDDGATAAGEDTAEDTRSSADTDDVADTAGAYVPTWCEGAVQFDYAPATRKTLSVFPDDYFTVPADTWTGVRVDIPADAAWIGEEIPAAFVSVVGNLNDLDGWAVSAGVRVSFSGPIDPDQVPRGAAESTADTASLKLVELSDDGDDYVLVPFEATVVDQGATVILWPLRPMRPKTRHALLADSGLTDADGGCIGLSPLMRQVLLGEHSDPRLAPIAAGAADVLRVLSLKPDAVSALGIFTTAATVDAGMRDAADIRTRDYVWSDGPDCQADSVGRTCVGKFQAWDYRNEGLLDVAPRPAPYTLTATMWLPAAPTGAAVPLPLLVFGHGMGGTREQGQYIRRSANDAGMAVVAIDAIRHGDHPTARGSSAQTWVSDLIGLDLNSFRLAGLQFRENLSQAAMDKLQLLRLLKQNPDLDGDNVDDLDMDRVAYYGVSLGGIMGPQLLALSEDVDAAVLAVAGGRLVSVITEADNFASLRGFLMTLAGGEDGLAKLAIFVQTLFDAGDASAWGPWVMANRLLGRAPHLLQTMAIGDGVVPNVANRALARSLGLDLVPPVVQPVALLQTLESAPVSGNLAVDAVTDGGRDAVTGALFQLDRVSYEAGGAPSAASHDNVFGGLEGPAQTDHFLTTWLDGIPEVIDPYATFGTPPLPPKP